MKKWQIYRQDQQLSSQLASELKVSPIVAQILLNRGFKAAKDAEIFLKPKLAYLKDPFDIPNIQKAAERIILAKERGEKVTIYGDYDVDGVTGTVILYEALTHLGIKTEYYIPHRYGEGYSLNFEAIKRIKENGTKLILTVDCGIASLIEIEYADSIGLEVIVTDHHNLPQKLPPAIAIVNPKMIEGEHPSKHLSGAGVAFKFAWVLLRTLGIKENDFLMSLLDVVALGTIADVVPLTYENRILTVCGMTLINEKKRLGIKALAEAAGLKNGISVTNVNFALAPRLNAAGRLEHAAIAVKLLIAKEPAAAEAAAKMLSEINSRRQGIGQDIQEDAFEKAKLVEDKRVIIVSGENWHPGVIGIVASRVVDTYSKPAVLIGINEGVGRGSARSINGVNIFSILDSCRDLFLDFGGHEGAAGFAIKPENIPELMKRIEEKAIEEINEEALIPKIKIDTELASSQITLSFVKELEALSPYGQGNTNPIFMTRNMMLKDLRQVGNEGAHLKLKLSDGHGEVDVIGFRLGSMAKGLKLNNPYNILYNLETNEWNGMESAQLNLIDIR